MDEVKRGPGRPKREIVPAPVKDETPAFTFALPSHCDQLNTDSLAVLDADVRNRISGALGCLYTLDMGKATTADGRQFDLRVNGKTLELVA